VEDQASSRTVGILIDHNIEGQAAWLWDILKAAGWLELLQLDMVMFTDVGLAINSSDREIWRFAQANHLILLTANRNMDGEDSLELTIREENTITSLPILTISKVEHLEERHYREQCAEKLLEIVLYLDNYRGTARIFIP
jgi:hypothetical protein